MESLPLSRLAAILCVALRTAPGVAQEAPPGPDESRIDVVQITATRFGEAVQEVPISMSVVTHDELVARGANDLRTALALVGGAAVAPGGDAGPAGAVPALLGVREADDFLLLFDGVPAGGAYTSPFETISLTNVERIEVLRGPAPVYYGTTAFAGTINVIHFKAGTAAPELTLSGGSHGSVAASGARALSTGPVKQSLALELSHDRYPDPRAGVDRALAGYRLAAPLGGGDLRFDFNFQLLKQKPASPTPVGEDGHLTDALGPDFNQNPGDARIDTQREQFVLGWGRRLAFGQWDTTASWTITHVNAVQGFLADDALDPGASQDENALGTGQSRYLHDLFFDTHVTGRPAGWIDLTCGLNEIRGRADQSSLSYEYGVPLDGSLPQPLATGDPQDQAFLRDRRSFFGVYAQSRLRFTPDISMLAGLRWNHTSETRDTLSGDAADEQDDLTPLSQSQHVARLNGSLGALWEVWRDRSGDLDDVALYANVGNTFQPAQVDFGIEAATDPLLQPETQRSLTFGVKADGDDGRWDFDLGAFFVDFDNQPVTSTVDGAPVLRSGGRERYQGVEAEASFRPLRGLTLVAHATYGESRYREYTTLIDGAPTSLDGLLLPLNPKMRAGAGVVYAPDRGLGFSVTANYTGSRYLDALNQVKVGGFTVLDASIGYRFDTITLTLAGSNLGDRRDALLPSELGEGQIYRMPARRVIASIALQLP
jgi:outer membrane receptor protein involved in Fe transport